MRATIPDVRYEQAWVARQDTSRWDVEAAAARMGAWTRHLDADGNPYLRFIPRDPWGLTATARARRWPAAAPVGARTPGRARVRGRKDHG